MTNIIPFPSNRTAKPNENEERYYSIIAIYKGNKYEYLDHYITWEGAWDALARLRSRYPEAVYFVRVNNAILHRQSTKWHEFLTIYNKE